jgi:hypothetical protein
MRKLVTVVMVVMALSLAACTSSQTFAPSILPSVFASKPLTAIDLSATPAGWVPVAYGDAQVSVPADFKVFYTDAQCSSILLPGTLLVGGASMSNCPPGSTKPNGTLVHFHPLVRNPAFWRDEKPTHLNGLVIYLGPGMDPLLAGNGLEYEANDYIVPSLGIEVAGVGPLAKRILNTLSRSPRTVVLATGPVPPVPSSWRSVTFAGLHFSVPADWPINRTQVTPNLGGSVCQAQGAAFFSTVVTLSTDTLPLIIATCLYSPPTLQSPPNAVQVDSGSRWASSAPVSLSKPPVSFSKHCLDLNGLTACPASSPAYSILVLKLTVPGRSKPVFVSIGLAGNGMVARTILYSIRAA